MFDLSQEAANSIFNLAGIALLLGAALVLLGAITAIWTSGIRDRYANARISTSAADTATASAEAERARADAARANLLAEQETVARLRLEARLADRSLTPEQQTRLIDQLTPFRGQTVDVVIHTDSAETVNFSNAIVACIERAGLPMNVIRVSGGTAARGVLIGVRDGSPSKIEQLAVILTGVLQDAVGSGIGRWTYDQIAVGPGAGQLTGTTGAEPRGTAPIRIVIGTK